MGFSCWKVNSMKEKDKVYLKYQKSGHQISNEKFNKAIGNNIPDRIEFQQDIRIRHCCAKLILEETFEVIEALGFFIYEPNMYRYLSFDELDIEPIKDTQGQDENNLEQKCSDLIKELCDLRYVLTGCLSMVTGAPDIPFQKIVDENNMSKISEGHSFNKDGKLIKPQNYKKVDFKDLIKILNEQKDDSLNTKI